VAADRVISTVPRPARAQDRRPPLRAVIKGHIAVDPDSEVITATGITAGNSGDAKVARDLFAGLLARDQASAGTTSEAVCPGVRPIMAAGSACASGVPGRVGHDPADAARQINLICAVGGLPGPGPAAVQIGGSVRVLPDLRLGSA
jgi:hypothetical protein